MSVLVILALLAANPALTGKAPLEFRCDKMQVHSKPNRSVCIANVLVRRSNLLVCCESFEGFADDDWTWQRFVCTDKVRAQRGDETVWAEKAEFVVTTSDLVLTGRPRLQRGKSTLEGSRVIIDVQHDRARIENPRVRIAAGEEPAKVPPALDPAAALPEHCPLPVTAH